MSSFQGVSNGLGLFQKDPTFNTLRNVKNPAIQGDITSLLGDWKTSRDANESGLSDYIAKYLAGNGAATARAGQEEGVMDQFYNGSMENQLSTLRSNRLKAINNAADVASNQALRNQDLAKLSSQGGEGSFDARSAIAALAPIRVNAAVQNADQERSDLGTLTGQQLSLMGQRTALADALANRSMMPANARSAVLQNNIGSLGGLSTLDNANHIYGVQQHLTDLDKWQTFLTAEQTRWNGDQSKMQNTASAAGSSM